MLTMEHEAVQAVSPGPNAAVENPPAAAASAWSLAKQFLVRLLIVYFISSMLRNWKQTSKDDASSGNPLSGNLFQPGMPMDVHVYLSEDEHFADFSVPQALFLKLENIAYGDWNAGASGDGSAFYSASIPCPPGVRNNGSLFMHVFVTKSGWSPNPLNQTFSEKWTIHKWHRLNKFRKKVYQKTKNLLTGETDASVQEHQLAEVKQHEILNYWHPNITINMVYDQTLWTQGQLPPPLSDAIRFDPASGKYYPIVYFNDYWNFMSDYQPINETVETLNLSVTYAPLSLFKWQLYVSQTQSSGWFEFFGSEHFEDSDEDKDSLKQALLDTNPYLLGLTVIVSILHMVFEFLAFKNDIMFWRNRESLEGLSVRSLLFNMTVSIIVFLYVLDNDANFVIRLSIFFGLLIDAWKVPKCLDISLDRQNRWFGKIPRLCVREKTSYVESSTKEYDMMAFKYLSWVLFPLLGGYAVYSLLYLEHRGWYSWVLSMLYGFLLTFGFIMMTPQLFINYKLKSVAHLPWRMLTYKFLNTFIDDLFAFVVKMPTLYRIGCFRDDIIFLIYLYQRWAYRVDPSRSNDLDVPKADAVAAAPGTATVTSSSVAAKEKVA
uniref:Cleft lip and palate transmembrane protein 1 n=1 Tax=Trichuris muris TaxID=70415 RepID=A0A5S6QK76_TRIMR